jgi:hypothetical protein
MGSEGTLRGGLMPEDPEHPLRMTRKGWPFVLVRLGIAATLLWIGFLGRALFGAARLALW